MGRKGKNTPAVKSSNKSEAKVDKLKDEIKYLTEQIRQLNYARLDNTINLSKEMYKIRTVSREALRRAMNDPHENADLLQQLSLLLSSTSGTYFRFINYLSNMNTFDYYISPSNITKFASKGGGYDKEKYDKAYLETALYLDKYKIKTIGPWITRKTIQFGEIYLYKVGDNTSIMMQQLPASFCTVTSKVNGVLRYGINLRKITDKTYTAFPLEIQNAYLSYKSGVIKKSDLIDGVYYQLSDKAVAFNTEEDATRGVPLLAFLFDDILGLEDMKDLKGNNAVIESIKLIHQKVPFGKNDEPLVQFDMLSMYHEATKANLPTGTSITTNPLELETFNLSDGTSKINDYVSDAQETIFDSAGISNVLFNSEKINTESVASGVISDSLITMGIQNQIETWLNYEMNQNAKAKLFNLKFIGTTHFNKLKVMAQLQSNITSVGDSRLMYLAATGKTPLEVFNLLQAEQLMNIDSYLVPKVTSYTLSSDEIDAGRPSNEETGNPDNVGNTSDRNDENS